MRTSSNGGWIGRKSGNLSVAQRVAAVQPGASRSPSLDLIVDAKKRLVAGVRNPSVRQRRRKEQ
jgi:hypothetical protein